MDGIRGRYNAINDGEERRCDKREGEYLVFNVLQVALLRRRIFGLGSIFSLVFW